MARRKEPRIPDHLLDQLLAGAEAKSAFAKDGLLDELKKAHADDQTGAETPVRDRADDRTHEGGRAAGTQLPAGSSRRCHECAARSGRAQSAADPELAQTFCGLVHCGSSELTHATGYCRSDPEPSPSVTKPHCSGPTSIASQQIHNLSYGMSEHRKKSGAGRA
jgi:hypothetical protein